MDAVPADAPLADIRPHADPPPADIYPHADPPPADIHPRADAPVDHTCTYYLLNFDNKYVTFGRKSQIAQSEPVVPAVMLIQAIMRDRGRPLHHQTVAKISREALACRSCEILTALDLKQIAEFQRQLNKDPRYTKAAWHDKLILGTFKHGSVPHCLISLLDCALILVDNCKVLPLQVPPSLFTPKPTSLFIPGAVHHGVPTDDAYEMDSAVSLPAKPTSLSVLNAMHHGVPADDANEMDSAVSLPTMPTSLSVLNGVHHGVPGDDANKTDSTVSVPTKPISLSIPNAAHHSVLSDDANKTDLMISLPVKTPCLLKSALTSSNCVASLDLNSRNQSLCLGPALSKRITKKPKLSALGNGFAPAAVVTNTLSMNPNAGNTHAHLNTSAATNEVDLFTLPLAKLQRMVTGHANQVALYQEMCNNALLKLNILKKFLGKEHQ